MSKHNRERKSQGVSLDGPAVRTEPVPCAVCGDLIPPKAEMIWLVRGTFPAAPVICAECCARGIIRASLLDSIVQLEAFALINYCGVQHFPTEQMDAKDLRDRRKEVLNKIAQLEARYGKPRTAAPAEAGS
jgi:hypothetical protein